MIKYLLAFLGVFVVFAAGGYLTGRSFATTEPALVDAVVKVSTVRLSGNRLLLEARNHGSTPFWTRDLIDGRSVFSDRSTALKSFPGVKLSPLQTQSIGFVSGGAASMTTLPKVAQWYKSARAAKDWRAIAVTFIGGATGFAAGYGFAMWTFKPSDEEALALLKNGPFVERVKEKLFETMAAKRNDPIEPLESVAAEPNIHSACKKDSSYQYIACVRGEWVRSDEAGRTAYRRMLMARASYATGSNDVDLTGYEFLAFALN